MKRTLFLLLVALLWASRVQAADRVRIGYSSISGATKIQDAEVLQRAYDFYMTKVLEKAPYINMAGVQNVLDDLAKTVSAAKNAKPTQFVDNRFLDTLEKSGLIKELYP